MGLRTHSFAFPDGIFIQKLVAFFCAVLEHRVTFVLGFLSAGDDFILEKGLKNL
jgi:hypothetical protein